MERLSVGSVTFHLVPYPDGTGEKRRPAFVLNKVNESEYWLLEITSQPIMQEHGVRLEPADHAGAWRSSRSIRFCFWWIAARESGALRSHSHSARILTSCSGRSSETGSHSNYSRESTVAAACIVTLRYDPAAALYRGFSAHSLHRIPRQMSDDGEADHDFGAGSELALERDLAVHLLDVAAR
jgi:hypothetical protein